MCFRRFLGLWIFFSFVYDKRFSFFKFPRSCFWFISKQSEIHENTDNFHDRSVCFITFLDWNVSRETEEFSAQFFTFNRWFSLVRLAQTVAGYSHAFRMLLFVKRGNWRNSPKCFSSTWRFFDLTHDSPNGITLKVPIDTNNCRKLFMHNFVVFLICTFFSRQFLLQLLNARKAKYFSHFTCLFNFVNNLWTRKFGAAHTTFQRIIIWWLWVLYKFIIVKICFCFVVICVRLFFTSRRIKKYLWRKVKMKPSTAVEMC